MDIEELREILEKKGMDWLIAAMVEGSIGYHSPQHAKRIIEDAIDGQTKDYRNGFKGARKLPTLVLEMNCPFAADGIVSPH